MRRGIQGCLRGKGEETPFVCSSDVYTGRSNWLKLVMVEEDEA
jgi:hypothetical protein